MPMCCVSGCRSNYTKLKGSYVTVFSFPTNEERKMQWMNALNRKGFVPNKSSKICIKHFPQHCIVRVDKFMVNGSTEVAVPRKRFKLTEDAVPIIFSNNFPTILNARGRTKLYCPSTSTSCGSGDQAIDEKTSKMKDNIVIKEMIFINAATGDYATEHEYTFLDKDPLSSNKNFKDGCDTKSLVKRTCRKSTLLYCDYCEFSTAKRSKLKLHIFMEHYTNLLGILIKTHEFEKRLHPVVTDDGEEVDRNMELQVVSCPQCSYITLKAASLEKHIQVTHTQEDIVPCPYCDIKLFGSRNFQAHLVNRHTKYKPLYCPYCEHLTVNFSDFMRHLHTHEKDTLIFCSHCYSEFLTHLEFKKHLIFKHRDKFPLNCPWCSYTSNVFNNIKYHLLFNHSALNRIFLCTNCEYVTSSCNKFCKHVTSDHPNVKPFSCFLCELQYHRFRELNRHIQVRHSSLDPFVCPFCSFHSHESQRVKNHIIKKHKGQHVDFIYTRSCS